MMKFKKINMMMFIIMVIFFNIYNCNAMVNGTWVENDTHFIVGSDVLVIPKNGLDNNTHKMEKLTIPDTVERVETGAMCKAKHLRCVNIGAREVEPNAFLDAKSLLEIRVLEGVDKLPVGSTDILKLNQLLESDQLSELRKFSEPGRDTPRLLSRVDEIYNIGSNPIFFVDSKNKVYSSDQYGSLYNKDKTILISFPSNVRGAFVTPPMVQYICARCFHDANISSLVVTDNVKLVNSWIFDLKYRLPRPFCTTIEIGLPHKILSDLSDYKKILSCNKIYNLINVYETPSDYNKLSELWTHNNDYMQFNEIAWPCIMTTLYGKSRSINSRVISMSVYLENIYLECTDLHDVSKEYKDQASMLCIDARG